MKISAINNMQVFKANLYYNGKQIQRGMFDFDDISERGAKNTDIYVSEITVKNDGYDNECGINFTLSSPIYGKRSFKNMGLKNMGGQNPNDSEFEAISFLYDHFALLENICKYYENKTLEKTLLQKINKNARENTYHHSSECETDAVKILDSMLSTVDKDEEGLSEGRIRELYKEAEIVNARVAQQGSAILLDKMA